MDIIKSEGNKHCCYGTCNSDTRYRDREDMQGVFFIPFPKPLTRRETCERWIKACGRPTADFNIQKIKRSTYICSKHFIGGKGPTLENPDPIPALLHTDEQRRRFEKKRKAPTPRSKPVKIRKQDVASAAQGLLGLGDIVDGPSKSLDFSEEFAIPLREDIRSDKATQTENIDVDSKAVQTVYEKEVLNAKIENIVLRNKMKTMEEKSDNQEIPVNTSLSLNAIKQEDAKMKLFTGLTFNQFIALYNFIGDSVHNLTYWDGKNKTENSRKGNRKMEPRNELFLTLVRLRRGYSIDTMAHFFGIAASTISIIFTTWIQLLYCHFQDFKNEMFPERNHFKHDLPRVFKTFKNIRCTIDCTEFFVQMPRDFKRQGNLYSSYKNHHTYKCLIAVAPNGAIVYVSDLYEGSISDRAIVEKSGFLDKINPGDLVLADRGFTIEDLLMKRQASLNIPPFLGKRIRFTAQEELKTKRIAKARIHVERVIERVKKFKLLCGNIPLSLSPISNQLVFVACCLVNFQEPLVK